MKEQEVIETVFENKTTGKKYIGKFVYVNGDLKELKIYDRTTVVRRLKFLNINENPDMDNITYKEIV